MGRKNGCEWPWNIFQVISGAVFSGLVVGYYTVFAPFVDHKPARIAVMVLYGVVAFTVAALDIYCSMVDPSDPGVFGKAINENVKDEYFCVLCQVKVRKRSKHCRTCDKCVDIFDHHCKWLNNCVGAANYRGFLYLVGVTLLQLVIQVATGIYLFVLCFTEKGDMRRLLRESSYAGGLDLTGLTVLLGVYLAILLGACVLLGELFFFHQLLRIKNLTTYDYIQLERERSKVEHRERRAARQQAGEGAA
eukprot:CAMPEP_0182883704 /NCGR_PEP_ID=MMETSP0034_2-20130328/18545_1 /TAXON_ID=156128 /ORGANISM="Nephroselmis pyriformis, Strain CCMP717" /LENGTH=247 /DNA_ID=CAMNT_0025016853 /DNA_START=176 /DNA_END=915 /DNA_ORIENTATION=-